MSWYKDWFNSKYYHILYRDRNDLEARKFITKLKIFINSNDKIIDIGCGKGRHSIFLNNLGFNVTGIDISNNNIIEAKRFEKNDLKFNVWDMRNVYKKNTFNVALNLFTSFGYFDKHTDNIRTIKAIHSNLKKNGILIIDFLNSKKVLSNLITNEEKKINGINFIINRYHNDGFIYKNIKFQDNKKNYNFTEKVQNLNLFEFKSILNLCEMKILNTFGNYELDPFNEKNSDRLIIVAKK
tara:strand:- start:2723 stop:3439 length:717 start_codon:yes stop_codon:yes gene_type:complete